MSIPTLGRGFSCTSYQEPSLWELDFLVSPSRDVDTREDTLIYCSTLDLTSFERCIPRVPAEALLHTYTQLRFDLFDSFVPLVKVSVAVGLFLIETHSYERSQKVWPL